MAFLMFCGLCCACLSVWAIIQLSFMGFFYYIETPILIEDVEEHQHKGFQDFIKKTRKNYEQNAYNCWATAGIYALTFLLSLLCIKISNSRSKAEAIKLENDELACITIMPKPPQLVQAESKKLKKFKKKVPKHKPTPSELYVSPEHRAAMAKKAKADQYQTNKSVNPE